MPIMGEDDAPTAETIRTYHNVGGLKGTPDLEIATALATYYDTTLADLSPDLADKARRKVLMLVGGGAAGRLKPGGDGPDNSGGIGGKWAAGESNPEPAEYMPEAA